MYGSVATPGVWRYLNNSINKSGGIPSYFGKRRKTKMTIRPRRGLNRGWIYHVKPYLRNLVVVTEILL